MSTARFRPSDRVDFVVVGSGAAGGVMAKELSTAGFRVVVLEQGPWRHEKDFTHDEISVMYRCGLTNDFRKQPNTFRKTPAEAAKLQPAVEYGRMVGGGSVHFTSNYWRFHPEDFRERSALGAVPGADLRDWPIAYDDLEPYYTKAEWDLGISGRGGSNPFDGPRTKPYPLPPMPVKSSGVLFDRAAKKLGLNPFPAPVAVLSRPYRGRPACVHCGFCESFGCEVGAKSSTLAALIPEAVKTGRCEIRPNSYVRKIEIGADRRIRGVIYFDAAGREVFQRAKAVVLSANGAETPRLLLMSKSNAFPQGLANSNGNVGKYLMFDNGALALGLFDHPLNEYKSIVVTRVLHDYYRSDPKRGFYGGGGLDSRFDYYPAGFALDGMPRDMPQWGSDWKRAVGQYYTHMMGVLAHSSCLAVEQNSISLDDTVKDAWGLPALRVTFQNHPDDMKTIQFLAERQKEILETAGARKVWFDPVSLEEATYSRHLMGTCRMGDDPRSSVVDRWNRAHDVPNLFVLDGSSLVTCGRQQPTATIQALAYRAADHIRQAASRGEI
ncbi:MAG TPA: GMC family oxidoreductase [Bryobacteraceae bacterium]|nr:GMC family oxidoreductase [Bryobacteraceae bacterium]